MGTFHPWKNITVLLFTDQPIQQTKQTRTEFQTLVLVQSFDHLYPDASCRRMETPLCGDSSTNKRKKPHRKNHNSTWPTNTANNLASFQKVNKLGLADKCSLWENGALLISSVGLEKPSTCYVSITKQKNHHKKK